MLQENIFFPIEGIYRELDYKLLLAAMLVEKDKTVTIAHHDLVDSLVFKSKSGVYFGKNIMRPSKYLLLKKYKKNNFTIVHLDEEGAIFRGNKNSWKAILNDRLKINTLSNDDHVLTWGEFQKNYYKSELNKNLNINIISTGTPRFELYKKPYSDIYLDKVKQIKKKFKNFILINTNSFPTFFEHGIRDFFDENKGLLDGTPYSNSINDRLKVFEDWSFHTNITIEFAKLAHVLSNKFPSIKILIRPHPGEDVLLYKIITKKIKNIEIITNKDQVAPWILASSVLIHNRCTTGAEAFFAKKPVINYDPIHREHSKDHILNKLGVHTENSEDVVKEVDKILNFSNSSGINNSLDNHDFEMLENFEQDSFVKIKNILTQIIDNKKIINFKTVNNYTIIFSEIIYNINNFIKFPIRKFFYPEKHKRFIKSKIVFSGFDKEVILEKIEKIEKILNKKIKLVFLSGRIFKIKIDS